MSFFNIKNPKVTHENISLKEYLSLKNTNKIEIVLFKGHNSLFSSSKNIENTQLVIDGVLLKYPICGKPKFSFSYNFYEIKENQIKMFILTEDHLKKFDDDYNNSNLDCLNKRFKTNVSFDERYLTNKYRKTIYGKISPAEFSETVGIEIYGSYPEYMNLLYNDLNNTKVEIHMEIYFQVIKSWDMMPIIDMMIKSYRDYSNDYGKIIKDENFENDSTRNFPHESKRLHE
jgi:hypothetical protein